VLSTRDMTPVADLLASEMYNEYLGPRDLHEGLRLDIWAGEGTIEDISLLRPWSAGPYDGAEIRMAHVLLPHLQRSTAVARRLREAENLAEAGLAALEHLDTAMLLLDRQGRLVHANAAGVAMLAADDGLAASTAGLVAAAPKLTRTLQAVLDAAIGGSGSRILARSGAMRLPRPSGRPSLALVALPLRPGLDLHGLGARATPAVLICITDPMNAAELPQRHLTALFGLTPAEASLANDLLAGHELRDIADRRRRSVHTVRTHLARLMAKTETDRQSELMKLLARLPLGRGE
jgi:DNA-binding CsgD family transcriptional regulator